MQVEVARLTKSYGDKVVLNVAHILVNPGTITGIIGPNGAGKTTLMNCIAGLDVPEAGTVSYRLDDGSSTQVTPLQAVTMLFQSPYLLRTTVEKNIGYPLRLRRFSSAEIKQQVKALMQELDLIHLANQKAWRLSGGEAQKVALARALALQPQLLLLDEPTSNIDNASVAAIEQSLLKTRAERHMTTIIISHNLGQIRRLCDTIVVLDKGEVVEQGLAQRILNNPTDPRARAFIAGELLL